MNISGCRLYSFLLCSALGLLSCRHSRNLTGAGDGFVSIFDGKTLGNWEGDPVYWRVEDGAIVGEVTDSTLLRDHNSFLIWRGGLTGNFELKVEYQVSALGNSGINYRSLPLEGFAYALKGYQADLDGKNLYTGSNYEERIRTTLGSQGEKVVLDPPPLPEKPLAEGIKNNHWIAARVTASLGNRDSLLALAKIKNGGWNEYHLIVTGNHMQHYVNGVLMSDVTDNDTLHRRESGLLGVQVHVGPPMIIRYRNFRLKTIP